MRPEVINMNGYDVAVTKIGLDEVKNNAAIREFLKAHAISGDIDINPARISWCAAFVNACEREAGKKGTGALNAQSFKSYGEEVSEDDISHGDIVVFHFPQDKPWQGHVTYFDSWDGDDIVCLGGNQKNMVRKSVYSYDYVTNVRRAT